MGFLQKRRGSTGYFEKLPGLSCKADSENDPYGGVCLPCMGKGSGEDLCQKTKARIYAV